MSLEGKIDLVIPRGSSELVQHITKTAEGRMPILGHTEGVCHVYVDHDANLEKAIDIGMCLCVFFCVCVCVCVSVCVNIDAYVCVPILLNSCSLCSSCPWIIASGCTITIVINSTL